MRKLCTLFAILLFSISFAQSEPRIEGDTLITSTGFKVYPGLDIKIGVGSMNDGDFKFIRTNATSMFNYYSTTGYQGLANQANSFRRSNSGLTFKVKKIMPRGSKKNGYVYYAKIGQSLINYEMDVENAIKTGEILVPEEFMPKMKNQTPTVVVESKYDKLKKLQELKDSGTLNVEEFESEKAKILKE